MTTVTLRWGVVLEDATVGQAGETHEVSSGFAAQLIARGRAVAVTDDTTEPVPVPVPKDPADGPTPVVMESTIVPTVDGRAAKRRTR